MNSSKKIDVSKSSLVSLRAELARKQEEVSKAKAQSQAQFQRPAPRQKKETILTKKNLGVDVREVKDHLELKEEEDLHKKSRAALEHKTQLYDKLSQSTEPRGDDDDNLRYLVDFQQKEYLKKSEPPPRTFDNPPPRAIPADDDDTVNISDESDACSDPDEDWVDYTDCLGRTRRCLRRDLASMKQRDSSLSGTLGDEDMPPQLPQPTAVPPQPLYDVSRAGDPELLSSDMRREMMREKWEAQERELTDRTEIHYQDVLFDEARSHGVGYYGFSGDEAQRLAQQEALSKLREDTKRQQDTTRTMRERRQMQLDARLKAARTRKRVRMGLPPEEDEPEPSVEMPAVPSVSEATPPDAVPSTKDAERLKMDQPVRPWDIGKEGVKEKYVMSQEEWVHKKRSERDQEFAPPAAYLEDMEASRSRPKKAFREKRRLTQSSTSIDDEISIPSPPPDKSPPRQRGGVEIAPPTTFEYYGPSGSGVKKKSKGQASADLESSIMAGLKYLRQQAEKKENKKEKGLLDIV